jgi:hypothetical protein
MYTFQYWNKVGRNYVTENQSGGNYKVAVNSTSMMISSWPMGRLGEEMQEVGTEVVVQRK